MPGQRRERLFQRARHSVRIDQIAQVNALLERAQDRNEQLYNPKP